MSDPVIAVILGIVEGLTEFIPVSSTGHLIVAGHLLGFTGERAKAFEVVIQLGAILAVVLRYRDRLWSLAPWRAGPGLQGRSGLVMLAATTLPALAVGAVTHGVITDRLFSPTTVAIGWGAGGAGLLFVERCRPHPRTSSLDDIGISNAVKIGVFQCLALWPGTSRAAATIGGGMLLGLDRRVAAEYSFLAALPVIAAASALELASSRDQLATSDLPLFGTGFLVAFVVAWIAVRWFLHRLQSSTLRLYGWYRISVATLLLALGT